MTAHSDSNYVISGEINIMYTCHPVNLYSGAINIIYAGHPVIMIVFRYNKYYKRSHAVYLYLSDGKLFFIDSQNKQQN